MLHYPDFIKPEIISIGPLSVRWYGLMYVIGFVLGFQAFKKQIRDGYFTVNYRQCENFITYLIVGMVLGARSFYIIFYNLQEYLDHPMDIFKIWNGGLSFHGAAIGMTIAAWLFGRHYKTLAN